MALAVYIAAVWLLVWVVTVSIPRRVSWWLRGRQMDTRRRRA